MRVLVLHVRSGQPAIEVAGMSVAECDVACVSLGSDACKA